jgi:PAS domain S-box-containing protein
LRKYLAATLSASCVLIAVVVLSFHIHASAKEKILSQFKEKQSLAAQQVAAQIESYFRITVGMLGIVALAFAGVSVSMQRIHRRKVIAEEETKHLGERQVMMESLNRQRDELNARSRILGATIGTRRLNERMDLILDKVMEFLGVEFGAVYLVRGDALELDSWRGISDEFRAHARRFPADGAPAFLRGTTLVRERLGERGAMPEFAKPDGMQSCATFTLNLPGENEGEGTEWLGTLLVGSRRFEALCDADVGALEGMVIQLSLAIDHARSCSRAEKRLIRLQALRDIDKSIIQNINLQQVLHIVLERVPKELGADAAAISLVDEKNLRTSVFAMRLPNGTHIEEEAFSLADSLLHWLLKRQETTIIYDAMVDPRVQMNRRHIRDFRIFSYLGVPLIALDKTIGVLHILTTEPKIFDSEDVEFFRTLAGQTAIAIENARATEALRESERKYRTLFEESKDAVYISTPEGRFLDVNPACVDLFGYASKEELLGADIPGDLYIDSSDRDDFRETISRNGYVKDFELAMKKKDGGKLDVLSTATAVRDEKGTIVAYRGIMRDLTRFKQLEHQFIQSQKMEAIGRLSGGLAHDINNYLGAMTGYCELVKMSHTGDEELAKKMEVIINTGFKASSLLKQLLAFSRKQPTRPEVISVNRVVEGMEKMLHRLIGEDVRLETRLKKDIRNIKADPSQMEQIIVNLVVNARNAMPQGGKITIETGTMTFDKDHPLNRPVAKAGEYVLLAVSDTGIGIKETIRDKIFEPFFTTDASKGSGLGLSTVYGIVKQNEGYLEVASEEGKGSTFRIYFPICREEIPVSEKKETPVVADRGKAAKILFVEDNDNVREAFGTVLERIGYRVATASDGERALAHIAGRGGDVDLLITDVVLPGINGKELMARCQAFNKNLKVLFISGYTDNVIASQGILNEGVAFLQKPFTATELSKKIAMVLAGP